MPIAIIIIIINSMLAKHEELNRLEIALSIILAKGAGFAKY